MSLLIATLSGLLFGIGLIAGGMTDPVKVKSFLDVFGAWDPSLALVMGGVLFGAGWGIAGYCPGPGIVAASAGSMAGGVFVLAMLVGMTVHDRFMVKR